MHSDNPDNENTPIDNSLIRQQYLESRNKRLSVMIELWHDHDESEQTIQYYLERMQEFYKPKRTSIAGTPEAEKLKGRESPTNRNTLGIPLSEIDDRQVEWLWPGRIPLGKITLLDGNPAMGKSLIAAYLAACITACLPLPGGTLAKQGGVVVVSPEDDAGDTLKPRFLAAGGNPLKILLLNTVQYLDIKKYEIIERSFSLSHDLEPLEDAIKFMNAVLVILDPLSAVLGRAVAASHDQNVREVFRPLAQLAQRYGCAILIIRHLNKGNSHNILYRGAGSIGIIAAARMGLIVTHDPDDENKRILATTKNNLSKVASNLTYQIVENEHGIPFIRWLGENTHSMETLFGNTGLSRQQQEILKLLKGSTTPLNPKNIAELTGQNYDGVRQVLLRMLKAGDLQSPGRGLYTTPDHPPLTGDAIDNYAITNITNITSVTNVTNVTTNTADIPAENRGITIDSNP
jgi:archaellum biogenesis ATPase FlaH